MLQKPDSQYKKWIVELKQRIQQSQIKAALRINSELIELYWELGKEISEKGFENTYGSGFFKQLSKDLKKEFPEIGGLSETNLKFFKRFYLFYNLSNTNRQQLVNELKISENENLEQVVRNVNKDEECNRQQIASDSQSTKNQKGTNKHQLGDDLRNLFLIPWGHHIQILTKCKTTKEAFFYINKIIENGWSRAVLLNMISANLIESQGKAITNFKKTLPDYDSELIRETIKDPYNFDFLHLTENFKEKELEDALIDNIQKFLIELGSGFAFVGRPFQITVSNKPHKIDLLFYHIKLKRYIVIDLKISSFEPEHAGKLNFYVTAVDRQLSDENEQATIGLLICKDKDEIMAEYSLADLKKPLGISSYELNTILPEDFKSSLPSIEEIEEELKNFKL